MEYCFCSLVAKEDLQGVYKTIFMFLEAQNFKETAKVFQQECAVLGLQVGAKQTPSVTSGCESLETALKQVMSTLKKIEYSITHGQKDLDFPEMLEGIHAKLKQQNKVDVEPNNSNVVVEKQGCPEIDYHRLDFGKIKNDLLYSGVENQVKLITALQLVIINKKDYRSFILENMLKYDLLYLKKMDGNLISYYMKNCTIEWMQESMARFVNTIASLKRGRDYLTATDTFIQVVLFPNILRQNISIRCQNMLIATLQKLSLRYASRNLMIRLGLLEYIMDYLEEVNETTPKYCLEYCSALLMNLCLENEGRNKCASMPKKIVGIMKKMLKGDMASCLPCVNGTLYSILVNKQVNNEAKLQKLDQLLQYVAKTAEDEAIKKQTNIILWSRFRDNIDNFPVNLPPHQELENEEEYLENELIEGINVQEQDIDVVFEKYLLNFKNDDMQVNWMCRPVTPASFKKSFNSISAGIPPENEDFNCGDTDETPNERGMIECRERALEYPKPNYELDTISCPSERREFPTTKKPAKKTTMTSAKITKSRKSFSEVEHYTKLLPQIERCTQSMCCKCSGCLRTNNKLKRRIYKMCIQ